ncbi:MAG: cytochrome D1 domain-containing protein [Verrucomicrobiota bacterium]
MANHIFLFDATSRKVAGSITVPEAPLGLAFSPDEKQLFVTCAAPESRVCVINCAKLKIINRIPAGHTAMAPVVSPDGKTLYVCNRFNNDVSVIDLAAKKEVCRVSVQREPVAAAITKDGRFLLVANLLPAGRADVNYAAAVVSVIDTAAKKVVKELQLPNGSSSLNDIRISPDGQYAVVTHVVGRFSRLTTHVTEGWINANALTLIDVAGMKLHASMLLDDHFQGAANPWGVAWSPDGATLLVTHAGTHEVSVIDFQKWLAHVPTLPANYDPVKAADVFAATKAKFEMPDDLAYFTGSRVRVKLPAGDLGPRSVVVTGHTAYVANYFSDTLSVIDLSAPKIKAESIPLGPKILADGHLADGPKDIVRKGEFYFHDATICYEKWQSCSSCHPGGARVDGLNWDLLNDGVGNPKNTRSLLLAHQTPPAMFLGVRNNAEAAVRAGIKFILFANQPEAVAASIDEYIKSLKPVSSPHLVHGKLSKPARRGQKLFSKAGCAECHVPGLYTDLHPYDVGTRASYDRLADKFYTPTLIEVWRTAPYLHNGSAATIWDVLTTGNPGNQHGDVSKLSKQEIDDLCEFVLSL